MATGSISGVAAIMGGMALAVYIHQTAAGLAQAGGADGAALYRTYCASCHGESGRGDGPIAEHLRVPPADLTQITRRNQGVFPDEKVRKAIDGREVYRSHGTSEMPVWGDALSRTSAMYDEESVQQRIDALVAHVEELQARRTD